MPPNTSSPALREQERYGPRRITSARVDVGPKCEFLDLNVDARCARPLLESGISRGGIDILRDEYLAGTDRSDDHLLYFVIDGSIAAISPDCTRRLRSGDLLISRVDRGLWLQLAAGEYCRGVFFHISGVARWESIKHAEAVVRRALDPAGMDFVMERLVIESNSGKYDSDHIGSHYAEIVLRYLDRELTDVGDPQARMMRHKLFVLWDRIGNSLHEDWTVGRMASEINVSAGYLHRLARDYHAMTPMEMLRKMRIDRAKSLLMDTTMTIEQIAVAVGYGNPFSLSNTFLALTGTRPGSFRKSAAVAGG